LITVDSVIGNINADERLNEEYQTLSKNGLCEKIVISRMESQRVRMRKTTDKGTDVGLILPQGTVLRNGDIIHMARDKMIVIELEPENVAVLSLRSDEEDHDLFAVAVKIGHALGNLHRPIQVSGKKIYVPIQAESEIELLGKIFEPLHDHLEISKTKIVFEPEEGIRTHEHT
jgi:urease accessory protein